MRTFSVAVYRVAEAYAFDIEATDHNDALHEALRRVKQRLLKPTPIQPGLHDLVALSVDGVRIGVATDVDDPPRRAR